MDISGLFGRHFGHITIYYIGLIELVRRIVEKYHIFDQSVPTWLLVSDRFLILSHHVILEG